MRNLLIACAAVAFVFPSFTAVADGSGSDGGPVVAAPAPTFAALGTAPAERMTTREMERLTASGQITHDLVRALRLDAFLVHNANATSLSRLGTGLFFVLNKSSP